MLWKLTQIQHTIGLRVLSSFWLDAAMQGLDYTWHFAGFFICCWKMANNACNNNNTNLLCKNYICTIEYFCKFEKMLKFCQNFDWNTWSDFKTRIQFVFLNYDFSLSKKGDFETIFAVSCHFWFSVGKWQWVWLVSIVSTGLLKISNFGMQHT